MAIVTFLDAAAESRRAPQEVTAGHRHLTDDEIGILRSNGNRNADGSWQNVWVRAGEGAFDARRIVGCEIRGFLVVGRLVPATVQFHDLVLETGLYHSYLEDVVTGDDVVVRNVAYLSNYRLANRVMLFNVQEMSCTNHAKFGNGILKAGESESSRIWIGVGNENDARAVLPFEQMIPADAFLWSRYREDPLLLSRFVAMTEYGQGKTLDTYGVVEDDAVIKNSTLLKDAKIGRNAYVKGAFKLKNITILSSPDEVSQIGEGVELVNGIVGYGSRVFYQAVAVRFVIGRNCQLKYGARLLNSVLGDNSTVSCCEILNNLIFPFHEQHHNSSFLIASTIGGQSNIASNATIGSNHNSRSPDGEMIAGRGFWPGLCSDFKYNSRFASFVLVAKGSYQHELNVEYPFSLVATNGVNRPVSIIPGYWFMYNMYAIARNKSKFQKRDKRAVKVQRIETDPFAPDTMQEVLAAIRRIIELTGRYLKAQGDKTALAAVTDGALFQAAKDFLHQNPDAQFVLEDARCQKKYGALIYKPVRGYRAYRKILKYFAAATLVEYCALRHIPVLTQVELERIRALPLYTAWVNVGGQIMSEAQVDELLECIRSGSVYTWEQVHAFYEESSCLYPTYKTTYALYLLEQLYSRPLSAFTAEIYEDILTDVTAINDEMYASALASREKDYEDYFRSVTFRNKAEQEAVVGSIEHNDFLQELKPQIEVFDRDLRCLFAGLH